MRCAPPAAWRTRGCLPHPFRAAQLRRAARPQPPHPRCARRPTATPRRYESDNCVGVVLALHGDRNEHRYMVLSKATQAPVLKYVDEEKKVVGAEVGCCESDYAGAKMIVKELLEEYEKAGVPQIKFDHPHQEEEILNSMKVKEPPITRYFSQVVGKPKKQAL